MRRSRRGKRTCEVVSTNLQGLPTLDGTQMHQYPVRWLGQHRHVVDGTKKARACQVKRRALHVAPPTVNKHSSRRHLYTNAHNDSITGLKRHSIREYIVPTSTLKTFATHGILQTLRATKRHFAPESQRHNHTFRTRPTWGASLAQS